MLFAENLLSIKLHGAFNTNHAATFGAYSLNRKLKDPVMYKKYTSEPFAFHLTSSASKSRRVDANKKMLTESSAEQLAQAKAKDLVKARRKLDADVKRATLLQCGEHNKSPAQSRAFYIYLEGLGCLASMTAMSYAILIKCFSISASVFFDASDPGASVVSFASRRTFSTLKASISSLISLSLLLSDSILIFNFSSMLSVLPNINAIISDYCQMVNSKI